MGDRSLGGCQLDAVFRGLQGPQHIRLAVHFHGLHPALDGDHLLGRRRPAGLMLHAAVQG